jgi:hypothetical protein
MNEANWTDSAEQDRNPAIKATQPWTKFLETVAEAISSSVVDHSDQ